MMAFESSEAMKPRNKRGNRRARTAPERRNRRRRSSGVDVTLIQWMLSMTPEQRLQTLENTIWSLMRLKHGTGQT
jgi:hypothetical protein